MSVTQIIILIICGLSTIFTLWWLGWKAGLEEGYKMGRKDSQPQKPDETKEWDFKKRRMN